MKPIIGNAARKEQFFPRPDVRAKIFDAIDSNENLLISSPRRVGKTSILLNLIDEPDENYYAVFVNTESCISAERFFEQILKAILDTDNLEGFGKFSKDVRATFKKWGEKIAGINLGGIVEVNLNPGEKPTYYDQLQKFLKEVNLNGKKILLLLDEFPVTLEHIVKNAGVEMATFFLNQNRELRQNPEFQPKIRFVYTGSVGLLNVARKMHATDRVNDLNEIKVGPLKKADARRLAAALFESRFGKEAPPETIEYMLRKIDLLLPFYIQLIVKELYELVDSEEIGVSEEAVDAAFHNLIRNGNIHLQHYKSRLGKIFSAEEQAVVNAILVAIKKNEAGLSHDEILNLAVGKNLQDELGEILETLLHDGYLLEKDNRYYFYSIILKHWWK